MHNQKKKKPCETDCNNQEGLHIRGSPSAGGEQPTTPQEYLSSGVALFHFLTHNVMLSSMLLKGLQNYVIIFPEVWLKNSPLPVCSGKAAIGIVIFLG